MRAIFAMLIVGGITFGIAQALGLDVVYAMPVGVFVGALAFIMIVRSTERPIDHYSSRDYGRRP